ncbi:uncharacterized protein BKA78DRAFT_316329 [Phyllosticta capitalensis]|uniref:uncharacterized protein n=1 Tax=Phyllosticta capitalensis TaxID=121624 RepID=UPI00312D5EF7
MTLTLRSFDFTKKMVHTRRRERVKHHHHLIQTRIQEPSPRPCSHARKAMHETTSI